MNETNSRGEVTFVEGQGDNGVDPPSSRGSLVWLVKARKSPLVRLQ